MTLYILMAALILLSASFSIGSMNIAKDEMRELLNKLIGTQLRHRLSAKKVKEVEAMLDKSRGAVNFAMLVCLLSNAILALIVIALIVMS